MGLADKPTGKPFEVFTLQLEDAFRECWTDNANTVSILYTGTSALKTDFTRTGKRTKKGALDDAKNSVKRYYINNYCDGFNHDCLDICLGKLAPSAKLKQKGFFTPLKLTLIFVKRLEIIEYADVHADVVVEVIFGAVHPARGRNTDSGLACTSARHGVLRRSASSIK